MLTFNDNKAGMAGLDKERINKIIESNTSGNYSNFSKKQQDRITEKTEAIRRRLEAVTPAEWTRAEKEMDELAARLECHRDLRRDCVHIDMDAFFAAVEMRDNPRLRTVPMAVGSLAMLSTSNYIARRFGVRAAMPGFIAKKLCPKLELVSVHYSKYSKESRIFEEIFAEYDEDLSMGSLDEAYLDITAYVTARTKPNILRRRRYGGECICRLPLIIEEICLPASIESCKKCGKERKIFEDDVEFGVGRSEIVQEIRFRVEQATGLTCSAGIAPNFMLAKICSDINKPNGQYELANSYEQIMEFLQELPIRKVSGIGRVSEALLQACGVRTVGELLERRAAVKFCFSPLSQECFLRTALGLPGRPSSSDPRRKSISTERTFTPTSNREALLEILEEVCDMLREDMPRAGILDILTITREILDRELPNEIRLLGIRLSHLQFVDDRRNEEPISVLEFWRRRQAVHPQFAVGDQEPSTSSTSPEEYSTSEDNVVCPICACHLKNDDRMVNQHMDECLNASLLMRELPQKTKPEPKAPKKRKTTIENFFAKK